MQSVEDVSRIFLRNVGIHIAVYTVSQSKISPFKHFHIRLKILRVVKHSADIHTHSGVLQDLKFIQDTSRSIKWLSLYVR